MMLMGCVPYPAIDSERAEILAIGLHERYDRNELRNLIGVNPSQVAWCAAYVQYVLSLEGIEGTGSLIAKSYLDWGWPVAEPEQWDIVIFNRNGPGWEGHVGFYMGTIERDGQTYYLVLGGNQSDRVSIEPYSTRELLGIRRYEY